MHTVFTLKRLYFFFIFKYYTSVCFSVSVCLSVSLRYTGYQQEPISLKTLIKTLDLDEKYSDKKSKYTLIPNR